jgi:hypothetical protein
MVFGGAGGGGGGGGAGIELYISLLSKTNLVISGQVGPPDSNCVVLVSPDMALPPESWAMLLTNVFDTNGSFTFTNAIDPETLQQFYRSWTP